jgi:hypothetical protein
MADDLEIVTPAELGVVTLVMITQEQLNQILQQLYWPPTTSKPKVEDPALYYGERVKLQAFLTQCEVKFNCEMNKFDMEWKRVKYASSRYWGEIELSNTKGKSIYETWEGFKTAISRVFGEADSKEVVRRKFKGIQ